MVIPSEIKTALEALDLEWARKEFPTASSDEVRIVAMHKARYELVAISDEARRVSAQYLLERGFHRLGGGEVLPNGELPI